MRDIDRLVQKATSQHGLLTTAQLRALGCTKAATETLVRRGVIERCRPGVVRLCGFLPSWEQRVLGVVLSSGRAVASHHSALRLLGLRERFSGVEVTVPYPTDCRLPGVRVHRSRTIDSEQVRQVRGIATTNIARTIIDVAHVFPRRELGRIIDHAVAARSFDLDELVALRTRIGGPGVHGLGRLDDVLHTMAPGAGAESGPERTLRRMLVAAGLPTPVPQVQVEIHGRRYRIDLAYPAIRLAIEYDGFRAHTGHARFEDDRRRQNDLDSDGWRVLRFTARDLREAGHELVSRVRAEIDRSSQASS